jgi:hypothetical protein
MGSSKVRGTDMADFFRCWHGTAVDQRWVSVGRATGIEPGLVAGIVWALLNHASQHRDRGTVDGFDAETYAAFSGTSTSPSSRRWRPRASSRIVGSTRLFGANRSARTAPPNAQGNGANGSERNPPSGRVERKRTRDSRLVPLRPLDHPDKRPLAFSSAQTSIVTTAGLRSPPRLG